VSYARIHPKYSANLLMIQAGFRSRLRLSENSSTGVSYLQNQIQHRKLGAPPIGEVQFYLLYRLSLFHCYKFPGSFEH